jgi:hypothetical protein
VKKAAKAHKGCRVIEEEEKKEGRMINGRIGMGLD